MNCLIQSIEAFEEYYRISLENNPFYVDGKGGQLGDRGNIGEARVLKVEENFLIVDKALEVGLSYPYQIDFKRQKEIAQQHTAQHIFSALAYEHFAWNTVGFRMAEEYSTVDFDTQEIAEEQIAFLEEEVNRVIASAKSIEVSFLSEEEARSQSNLRKAIHEKVKGEVRMVSVPGVDSCACAGFHVKNTLEIGLFKVIYQENVKGKFTRFHFLAGVRALRDYQRKHQISRELTQIYSCKTEEILMMQGKEREEKQLLAKDLQQLSIAYAPFLAEQLKKDAFLCAGKKIIFQEVKQKMQQQLLSHIPLEDFLCVFFEGEKISMHGQCLNCKLLLQQLMSLCPHLKGGGTETKANLKGKLSKEELCKSVDLLSSL